MQKGTACGCFVCGVETEFGLVLDTGDSFMVCRHHLSVFYLFVDMFPDLGQYGAFELLVAREERRRLKCL